MLSIIKKNGEVFVWHVGETISTENKRNLFSGEFDNIQLDNDELEIARKLFPNVIPHKRVVRIYGDLGKTVSWNII